MIPDISKTDVSKWIIYQDENLLAVNKPSGFLTIPGGFSTDTPVLKPLLEGVFGELWTIHRLDKDTSGIILFARNAKAHSHLNQQFDRRQVSKEYRAIVYGVPEWKTFDVNQPLLVNGDRSHRTIPSSRGKPAFTAIKVLHHFPCFTYLSAHPKTGLTHQIRAHLSSISFPILADELYAKKNILPDDYSIISRLALHAYQIQFEHPVSLDKTILCAPIPDDFRSALDQLPSIIEHDPDDLNAIYKTVTYQASMRRKKILPLK
jgi:RluA family pseudouridine synthase